MSRLLEAIGMYFCYLTLNLLLQTTSYRAIAITTLQQNNSYKV